MMSNLEVTQKLSELQRSLNVPKKRHNKHLNYYYRNADDILTAVKPMMPEGCYITISDEIAHIGDRFYVKARATFVYNDMQISTEAYAREPQSVGKTNESMITGAASSYARKYALSGLLILDDGEDADSTSDEVTKSQADFSERISNDRALRISELVSTVGADRGKILAHYHVSTFNELTVEAADHLERNLELRKVKGSEYARV